MRKKNAKILNAFEQKIQTNQSKNLYHQNNKNKHYLYAKINLDDSIEKNNNENTKENYVFYSNGNISLKSKKYFKDQIEQTSTLYNKRPLNNRQKNKKKIFELKKINIYSKISHFKTYYLGSKFGNEELMKKEENKEDIKEEKKDKENGCERPEDISDYISIDNIGEQDYNNYKTLSGKIGSEAIEEVEEAKEASELRQSSEFYNNISSSKSNPKKNMKDIWIKKNIYQKKDSNNKNEDNNSLFSKYLTFNKKEMNNKSNQIISKIAYKKSKKNISPYKKTLYSNVSINSNNHKNTMNFDFADYFFNKSDRGNLISKKNFHIIKGNDNKNRTSNNSNKHNSIFFKNGKNEYLNSKEGKKTKKIIIKLEYSKQRDISLKNKNMRKLDKNKNTSQTVPNLKKYYNNKNKENRDMIKCMDKIIKNYSNGNKEKLENNNKFFEENKMNLMKSMIISKDYHYKRYELYETRNKYCKLFYSRDKNNKLNKTNDRIKDTIKIYSNYFNNDDKTRNKKVK